MSYPPPISQQLPFDVRTALVNASKIKNPVQRMAAIEQIQAMAKARFPKLFQGSYDLNSTSEQLPAK